MFTYAVKSTSHFFLTFFFKLVSNLFFICPLQYKKVYLPCLFLTLLSLFYIALVLLTLYIVLVLLIFFELLSFFFVMLCSQCFIFYAQTCNVVLIVLHLQHMHLSLDRYLIFCIFFSSICFLRTFTTCYLHYYFLCKCFHLQQKRSSYFSCYLFVSFILLVLDLPWIVKVIMLFSHCVLLCWLIYCKSFLQVVQMQLVQQHSTNWRWFIEVCSHTCYIAWNANYISFEYIVNWIGFFGEAWEHYLVF